MRRQTPANFRSGKSSPNNQQSAEGESMTVKRQRPSVYSRRFGCEPLESRRLLSATQVLEVENNDTIFAAQMLPGGFDPGESSYLRVEGSFASASDTDVYLVELEAGDMLDVALFSNNTSQDFQVDIINSAADNTILVDGDVGILRPDTNIPLASAAGFGSRATGSSVTATRDETFLIAVNGESGPYGLELDISRPALEEEAYGTAQVFFLEFHGGTIYNDSSGGVYQATPFITNQQLTDNGFQVADRSAITSKIISTFEENLKDDLLASGVNSISGGPGGFDVIILNSDEHSDPGEQDHVSRIVFTSDVPAGAPGGWNNGPAIAEKNDIGNRDSDDIAVVMTDAFLGSYLPFTDIASYQLGPGTTLIEFLGTAIGNVATHEASHILGMIHSDNAAGSAITLTDSAANSDQSGIGVANLYGVDPNGVFTGTIDIDFGADIYVDENNNADFSGVRNSTDYIAHLLSTGTATPRVTGVTIGSTLSSTPQSHSILAVEGAGEQLRTVPVGKANSITIEFSRNVTVSQGDLSLTGLRTPIDAPSVSSFSTTSTSATWVFDSEFAADQYLLTLSDNVVEPGAGVARPNDVALDGEWRSPTDLNAVGGNSMAFPSGDGLPGGDFEFVFTILPGDANRDNLVDLLDLGILGTNSGSSGGFGEGDFTGDGNVDLLDLGILGTNFDLDLRLLQIAADLNGDFVVDSADLAIFNDPGDPRGDLDQDGDKDSDDLDNYITPLVGVDISDSIG